MSQTIRHFLMSGRLDRFAIALSGLCLAHCFITAVVLGLLATAGGIFESPIFHEAGLVLAILRKKFAFFKNPPSYWQAVSRFQSV